MSSIANLTFDEIAGGLTDIQASLNKYIVRPTNAFGLGGFVFDVEGETETQLQADITDHFSERNDATQDHIATKPLIIRLGSYVGELVYRPEGDGDTTLQNVVRKLTIVSDYLPKLTFGAAQAKAFFEESSPVSNLVSQETISSAASLYGAVKDLIPPTSRQQQAFMFFKALFEQKILTSVDTPYGFLTDMAIQSVTATQKEESRDITEFSITLKQMRFFETKTTLFDPTKYQGATAAQAAPPVDGGKTQGVLPTENKSALLSLSQKVGGIIPTIRFGLNSLIGQ